MKTFAWTGLAISGAIALAAPADAAIVTDEDFEAGASGWSNNLTEDPGANGGGFTRHLGRHGAGSSAWKTFTLTGTQSRVSVSFDFYRLDSWDGETFFAEISDGVNSYVSFGQYSFDDAPNANIYNPSWGDSIHTISFDFATTATSVSLSFASTLNQPADDEAWGVDNLLITDDLQVAPGIPEPSAWALFILGFGVVGGALRRSRKVRAALTYA